MLDELERGAYISGRQAEAVLLGRLQDQTDINEVQERDLEQLDDRIRRLERQLRQLLDALGSEALAVEITLSEALLMP